MSQNPQQPNSGQSRPMPPNYSQASGPQQPYAAQQPSQSQQPDYGSQQQPGYGSQQNYGSQQQPGYGSQQNQQQNYGSQQQPGYGSQPQNPQSYGGQQYGGSQQQAGYGSQQNYGAQQGQAQYGAHQAYGVHQGAANPALFNSQALPAQAYGEGSEHFWNASESERSTALWTQVGAIFLGWLLPLIMFLVKKDESPFIREHTRQSLNFQLTLIIGYFVSLLLMLVIVGYFTYLAIWVLAIIFQIIAAVAANKGQGYKIPMTINMVK